MHYYKHNIKDFNAHTAHLTRLERDIYRQMIEMYYLTEEPLIGDKAILYRKLSIRSEEEKEAADQILKEFFSNHPKYDFNKGNTTKNFGVYHHSRCDEEITTYRNRTTKAKEAAKKRWDSKGNANALPTTNHKPLTIKKMEKPTIADVIGHIQDITTQPQATAQEFINHYNSVGWVVGRNKTPMKCWKSSATQWVNRKKGWEEDEKNRRNKTGQTKQEKRDEALIQLQ